LPAGLRSSFQSTRYVYLVDQKGFPTAGETYLVDWKEDLLACEVHVPCWLEGRPSSLWGTRTLLTGRKTFQSVRYTYLVDWKEDLPAGKVVPCSPWEAIQGQEPCVQGLGLGYPWR
jgi:hypothetical protein